MLLFKRKAHVVVAPAYVTPDPQQVAALERRLAELSYRPTCGFLRDQFQARCERPATFAIARFVESAS